MGDFQELRQAFEQYQWQGTFGDVLSYWRAPHRFYHSASFHLEDLVDKIEALNLNTKKRRILRLAALFHDAAHTPFTPGPTTDEQQSAFLIDHLSREDDPHLQQELSTAKELIRATEEHEGGSEIADIFVKLDTSILRSDRERLVEYENALYKEFQALSYDQYEAGRVSFLRDWAGDKIDEQKADFLISYVQARSKTRSVAIYPGTFHPFHLGHYYVLNQAKAIFDKVIILVGTNVEKQTDPEKISRLVRQKLPYTDVRAFENELLPRYLDRTFDETPTVVKGLRNGEDLDEQETKAQIIRDLERDLPTTYITCPPELRHVSSSGIRGLRSLNEQDAGHYTRLDRA